jgi:hypothetical protein
LPHSFVRVVGEDTDEARYELKDGEEIPLVNDDDIVYPAWKTFVMKYGDHRVQYLSESEPISDVPEPNFDEIKTIPIPQWPSSP